MLDPMVHLEIQVDLGQLVSLEVQEARATLGLLVLKVFQDQQANQDPWDSLALTVLQAHLETPDLLGQLDFQETLAPMVSQDSLVTMGDLEQMERQEQLARPDSQEDQEVLE